MIRMGGKKGSQMLEKIHAYQYEYKKQLNEDGTEKHIVRDGARFHVITYNGRDGAVCSEPDCEMNRRLIDTN